MFFFIKRIGIGLFRRYFLQTKEVGRRGCLHKGGILTLRHARDGGFFGGFLIKVSCMKKFSMVAGLNGISYGFKGFKTIL